MTDEHGRNLPAERQRRPRRRPGRRRADPPTPGLPEHAWRPTDVDPRPEKRAERQIAALFGLSAVCAVLFVVAYFAFDVNGDATATSRRSSASAPPTSPWAPRSGGALLLIGIGLIQWARKLMGDHEIVEMRHPARSSDEDREETLRGRWPSAPRSPASPAGRWSATRCSARSASCWRPVVVLLRDLGPTNAQVDRGRGLPRRRPRAHRLGRGHAGRPRRGRHPDPPRRPRDRRPGQRRAGDDLRGRRGRRARARGRRRSRSPSPRARWSWSGWSPTTTSPAPGRENWAVDGILCYSKICTHVGCPISLNERKTHHLLCPCHQSTFDLADAAQGGLRPGRSCAAPAAAYGG